jgi:lipoprotein-releasing system permease protein
MRFELFVALRYLFARKGQAFISVISWISVAGVALGVASLIVVMGVMNGFTTDLRDKLIGMSSHAVVYSRAGGLEEDRELLRRIGAAPGVVGVTPFIQSGVLLSSHSGGTGVYLRGVDPDTAGAVLDGLKSLSSGRLDDLKSAEGLPGVILGEALAGKLAVHVGSRVNIMSPSGQQGAAGLSPRVKPFRVVGIFSVGLADYDGGLAVVSLDMAREALGWQGKRISGVEAAVSDVYQVESVMREALKGAGDDALYAATWMEMNANLYAALKLEKAAMAVILALVILVGSFSIVTALVMLVMEKTRDIAVMMAMGASTGMVRTIFMLQGTIIGLMGSSLGCALGLGTCVLLKRYKFVELPRGVYSLDYLPVLLQWPDLLLTVCCAMLLCFLATLYPAGQAARLEPADALRHE